MIFSEANALKNLIHKNIVKIIDCYIFQDMRAVFIMEYLKGVLFINQRVNYKYLLIINLINVCKKIKLKNTLDKL